MVWECSHLDASPPPAESLGADIGGDEVAVAHSPRPAEEIRQAVSHAGCRVAGSLLCCNAASGEQKGFNDKIRRHSRPYSNQRQVCTHAQ